MKIQQNRILDPTGKSFERSLPRLPVSAVVMAAEDIDLGCDARRGTWPPRLPGRLMIWKRPAKKPRQLKRRLSRKKSSPGNTQQSTRLNALEATGVSGAVPIDAHNDLETGNR
jgi:hypothetical protein